MSNDKLMFRPLNVDSVMLAYSATFMLERRLLTARYMRP